MDCIGAGQSCALISFSESYFFWNAGGSNMSKIISSLLSIAAASVTGSAAAVELLTNPDLNFPNSPPGWTLLETGGVPPTPREAAKQQDFADFDGGGLGLWLEAFQGLFFGN